MARKKARVEQTDEPPDKLTRIREGIPTDVTMQMPLTSEHLNLMNECLKKCATVEKMCAICTEAGIDVAPEAQSIAETRKMAETLKRGFFPTTI